MNWIERTPEFDEWLRELKDQKGKARIATRINAASLGHFGDCKLMEGGIWEMRIDFGPGYRVYYARRGQVVYLLLVGGDKSTQRQDIAKAKTLLQNLPKE
jgi:putative addiction module killer protein